MKKPKTSLPDGSRNPAYQIWYRSTPKGIASLKKHSDKRVRTASAIRKEAGRNARKEAEEKAARESPEAIRKQNRLLLIQGLIMEKREQAPDEQTAL